VQCSTQLNQIAPQRQCADDRWQRQAVLGKLYWTPSYNPNSRVGSATPKETSDGIGDYLASSMTSTTRARPGFTDFRYHRHRSRVMNPKTLGDTSHQPPSGRIFHWTYAINKYATAVYWIGRPENLESVNKGDMAKACSFWKVSEIRGLPRCISSPMAGSAPATSGWPNMHQGGVTGNMAVKYPHFDTFRTWLHGCSREIG